VTHDPREEALALIAASREILVELLDEGLDAVEFSPRSYPKPSKVREKRDVTKPMESEAGFEVSAPEGVVATPPVTPPLPREPSTRSSESRTSSPTVDLSMSREGVPWGPDATLAEVQRHLGDCKRCGLCERRNSIVFGSGNPQADLMFIGEGPGEQEDRQGLPFVGRAGELLTQMLEKGIEVPRDDVYICNIVKCRPPGNRNPLPDEVAACRPFLDGQIDAVRPKVIVSLGKPAASLLLGRNVAITRIRGTWQEYKGIPLMPTLHPAYVLRQYTPENRGFVWQDLKAAIARVRGES